ncbi:MULTISPECIES: HNH endonuclease [Staphylococcus]|uniref:HNH endonuclease n=1 Tax=Staphylococcus TaxID=1279 RepID=UPI0008A59A61|nr:MULTISPECIES: HNH endonuclease signature motif containing protein [Staphylococcus]DAL45480.1 MAG TPA_asm: NinG recombination protein [Caudoviricetes sp.]MBO0387553.1 HNH endonuclease [Staphylococcus simulans]OFJ74716.1 alpha/beta hydrolase [Staphylococcus sp. HMSC056G08]OHS43404.1 alpha/beta hydrolase [Staphylococcus sp. HMSC65H10]VED60522.1 phage-associated homing endonuclease [Staphylococcus simulans]
MSLNKQQQRDFYNGKRWRDKREAIKARDNFECQECKRQGKVAIDIYEPNKNGRKKIKLVVHHIKELADYPELALDDDNLETLCVECHNKIHDRYFKNWYRPRVNKWDGDENW